MQNGLSINDKAMGMGSESIKNISSLTPEEVNEISQTDNLISKDSAVALVDKYVGIPDELELESAHLDKDWQEPDNRIWTLQWTSRSTKASPAKSLYSRVDALTGELLSFNLDIPKTDEQKPILSRIAAQRIAEDFIKKVCPQHFKNSKLSEDYINSANEENLPNWYFNYHRIVNGIDCPGNGIEINVDRVNKQITSFYINWTNQQFPETQNTLGLEKANNLFLQGLPMTLAYTIIYNSQGPVEMKLVYSPQSQEGNTPGVMINAQTGEWLNNEGKSAASQVKGYTFSDIAGNFAENEIALLGQAGIFGDYDTTFHPNENITLVSLLRAILTIRDGYPNVQTDQDIMNRAKALGWLEKEYSPSSTVDREMMARLITHYLDLDYLVRVPGLFRITFNDSAAMTSEFRGYAALIWGMGIIKGDGINFTPAHILTRAEAACYLVRTLKAKS
jgi:hypothetical protein